MLGSLPQRPIEEVIIKGEELTNRYKLCLARIINKPRLCLLAYHSNLHRYFFVKA